MVFIGYFIMAILHLIAGRSYVILLIFEFIYLVGSVRFSRPYTEL